MRKYIVAGIAMLAASPAYAATPSITFSSGTYGLPSYCMPACTIFQEFDAGVSGSPYVPKPGESVSGPTAAFYAQGNQNNVFLNPDADNNNYLAIENGTYTVALNGAQFFSFAFGSLDSYNKLVLTLTNGDTFTYLGQQIVGGPAPTGFANYATTGRVSFNANGGFGFASAAFSSTQAAFEIDALASAAPEPATWALMILGFGLMGTQLRSLRRKDQLSLA